jgi:hypothetical protein
VIARCTRAASTPAAAAGRCRSPAESEAFYQRITDELHKAAAEGRLATRAVPPFGMAPCPEDYLPHLPASLGKLFARCWAHVEPKPLEDHLTDVRQLFDTIAHRRPASTEPTAQSAIRSGLWTLCGPILRGVLIGGALLGVVVLFGRRGTPGRGWYFFTASVLGLAGFSRLGLFALIDASVCPADALRYLFPAALLLSALAVWLSGEGLRLFRAPNPARGADCQSALPRSLQSPTNHSNGAVAAGL